ncbi:ATP-dependent Clp protease ATP-binding subunit [Fusibacter ferrireducens]|uniref:ATP-dependent Clp protease ATP-binding subunit n=1 Tax=Fusibacter ferrireducens TaxID=2785058 RepID=A0ABR9ZZS2_9FIRM|nr:ATP-dependent Clp protease ATP-binding subunit [Fusibacter ferrireducens]MBF4695949.1 ATP-dependent Clp protease ATP-binding subunit [Fusibacter ferrireducens]
MFKYNFDENANDVINFAFAEARDLGHRFVGTEHLILGLSIIKNSKVHTVFDYYKITTDDLRLELIKRIGKGDYNAGIEDYTPRAKACIERSYQYSLETNSDEIMPEHILMSIMQDKYAIGYKVLTALSLDVQKMLLNILDAPAEKVGPKIIKGNKALNYQVKLVDFEEAYDTQVPNVINRVGINLTEIAKDSPYQEIIGREREINRLIQILSRKTKNNPCILGEPGVGKTALVHGLANRIASGRVPEGLKDKEVILINISYLVSGTMFRGQFEERFNELLKVLKEEHKYIAFFDELHNLIGAGATGEKSLDAMGMLKPLLTTGEIQMIGATTFSDFQKYLETDEAMMRRLIPLKIEEPTKEESYTILQQTKHQYENHHDLIISNEAIDAAIRLSQRYITDRRLPDKAIDIIDEACSKKRIESLKTIEILDELKYRLQMLKEHKEEAILEMDFENASKLQTEEKRILSHIEKNEKAKHLMQARKLTVDVADIEQAVSEWTNIPVTKLQIHEKENLRLLEKRLSEMVLGQEQAINMISNALKRSRLGIKDARKPVGTFLFVGPTGVGKTELAKSIADVFYGDVNNLIKFDMSEYMEKYSVSKLIGSPPGYEGNKEGGLLTNAVKKMPYSVIVFDEVEKADFEVLNILLSIMDEGQLKDGRGKQVDFKNTLLILTSNLGVEELSIKTVGFGGNTSKSIAEEKIRAAAKNFFKPEFINRIDEIIVFNALELNEITRIVEKELVLFKSLMQEQGIQIHFDSEVSKLIAETNFDEKYGARPIKRAVDRLIKDKIADLMLNEEEIEAIEITVEDSDLKFSVN